MFLFTSPDPSSAAAVPAARVTGAGAGAASGAVTDAIRNASRATGVSFDYLLDTARRESGLDPAARAGGSSATGLFQFIDSTWLQMVKEAGPELGLGDLATGIQRSAGGYTAQDPGTRQAVLALRQDPNTAALVAAAFTQRNAQALADRLGRPASAGELYIAHLMGAQGAAQLIGMAASNPGADASAAFPAQAAANPAIFRDASGAARSIGTVYAALTRASQPAALSASAATAASTVDDGEASGASGPAAWLAVPAARSSSPFTGLFRTDGRGPLSKAVVQEWAGLRPEQMATPIPSAASSAPAASDVRIAADPVPVAPLAQSAQARAPDILFGAVGAFVSGLFGRPAAASPPGTAG